MLIIGGVFYSALYAQNNEEYFHDFEYVSKSDPWLTSNNASGLYKLLLDDVSYGEVSFNKNDGKFINYYQSDNSYVFGGKAESFYRLSPKVVVYGKVLYDNFKGKHMGGASFIDPYYNPFNIVAEADSTAGEKQMENYHLIGAISVDVYKGLKVGGKIDYLATNYAKFKDLRHKNKLTDLSLTIGASYPISNFLEVGINYFYRRTIEGIEFKRYGNKDMRYYSLIDLGAFFGRREEFSDGGYTKDGDDKPLFNRFNGGSVQLGLRLSEKIKLFNELTYKSRDGFYGKNSSSSIIYSKHNASVYEYSGVLSIASGRDLHSIELYAGKENLENNENIYNVNTTPGGLLTIIYYGTNKVLDQDRLTAKLAYTANVDIVNYNPTWVLKADINFYQQKKTASLYPYYRKQTINVANIDISANRNVFTGKGQIYKLLLGTGFSKGGGTDKNDGIYSTGSSGGSSPIMLDSYLHREYEYLTNLQIHFTAGFGYQRPIDKDIAIYGNVQYQVAKGLDVEYLSGSTFGSLGITVGCYF